MQLKFISIATPLLLILLLGQCSGSRNKPELETNDFDRFKDFVPKDMKINNCYLNTINTKDSIYYFEILVLNPMDTCKSRQVLILQETPKGLVFSTKCDSAILNPKFGIDPFINIFPDSSGFSIIHAGGDDNWEMKTTFQFKQELKDWFLTKLNSKSELEYNGCDTSAMFGPLLYMENLSEKDFGIIRFSHFSIYTFGANR